MIRADRIRDIRLKSKISTRELAELSGMSHSQIVRYEQGKSDPSSMVVIRYCELFGVSADYLLGLSDSNNVSEAQLTPDEFAAVQAWRKLKQEYLKCDKS